MYLFVLFEIHAHHAVVGTALQATMPFGPCPRVIMRSYVYSVPILEQEEEGFLRLAVNGHTLILNLLMGVTEGIVLNV